MIDKMKSFNPSIGKKAMEIWISWLLIIALTVSLGAVVYSWVRSYSTSTSEDIELRNQEASCDSVAIVLTNACQTTTRLYVDVENKKDLKIQGILFSFIDIYGNSDNREINRTLNVGQTLRFDIIKQGTIKKIEAVPIIKVGSAIVYCTSSQTSLEDIRYC